MIGFYTRPTDHSARTGRIAVQTGRPPVAAGTGTAVWYLQRELAPWLPSGTVPITDLIRDCGLWAWQ